jgi:hypothetical protein
MNALTNFIYARSPYRGPMEEPYIAFDAWLQRFAQQVSYICCLETSGKLPAEEAYRQLKRLARQLERHELLVNPARTGFRRKLDICQFRKRAESRASGQRFVGSGQS